MFLDFYQLKEQPFSVTPDPRYLYLSGAHRETLASLMYGIKEGRGLMALVAQPGMGKTTLLFRLLQHLGESARTVFLFQTRCDSWGLLRYLLANLGIDTQEQDFVAMHEQLNELLLREKNAGRRVVVVIDEAQNLDPSVLETARLLLDFETPSEKLLQIVLSGQAQLAETLQLAELVQLRQRVAMVGRLEPLNAAEVADYIGTRLAVAGYKGSGIFTSAALNRIAISSGGIPRNINNLCFGAMSLGCALGRQEIDADLVDQAASDLDIACVQSVKSDSGSTHRGTSEVTRTAKDEKTVFSRLEAATVSTLRLAAAKSRTGRWARMVPIAVLALIVAVLYRQDLGAAAVQTRKTLVVAASNLSSHRNSPKPVMAAAPSLKQSSPPGSMNQVAQDFNSSPTLFSANSGSANSGVSSADPPVSRTLSPKPAVVPIRETVRDPIEDVPGTIVVEMQFGDDLRQLCLRHLGIYSESVANKIMKLNPDITDPDRIAAGQRILLPQLPNPGRYGSGDAVPKP